MTEHTWADFANDAETGEWTIEWDEDATTERYTPEGETAGMAGGSRTTTISQIAYTAYLDPEATVTPLPGDDE